MSVAAYPLSWPPGFPRATRRESGAFKTSLAGALKNVEKSLEAFARDSGKKIEGLVISSDVTLGVQSPKDPGVSVWFVWDGLQVCIPVDRYAKVEANLQAIHHIIEARRTELRHGTLALVRASFTGFKALPPPSGRAWWQVLEFGDRPTNLDLVKERYRSRASMYHPDKEGGSTEKMVEINRAWEEAQRELAR